MVDGAHEVEPNGCEKGCIHMEIKPETVSRENLCGFVKFCGLSDDTILRCSTYFLFELFVRARCHSMPGDPAKIIAEIRLLEGYGRQTGTKEAALFDELPLRGFWHKHYLTDNSLAKNLQLALGGPKLKRLRGLIEEQRKPGATHLLPEDVPDIAWAITALYPKRAERGELTGEWIVYAKHEGKNYYLSLGNHREGDEVVFARISQTCSDEFHFIASLQDDGVQHP